MTQLLQFVTALVHDPELIILDEPLSGLDSLNVELIKELLFERQRAGATIMFNTHIMSDFDELCERVTLFADGRLLLLGDLAEIKRQRGAYAMQVQARGIPDDLTNEVPEVLRKGVVEFAIEDGRTPDTILRSYLDAGIEIERFELSLPSLNDIFVQEVSRARAVS
ncbi:MAG: DUF4162 domain-containing protein [Actinomycetia bacterium]|nr:DUF4162 domain-containing protein [Actinomycetes bacterium]